MRIAAISLSTITISLALAQGLHAQTAPTISSPYLMLYNISANTLGAVPGEYIRFGAGSVLPNGDHGTTGIGTTINTSTNQRVTASLRFIPSTVAPNQFDREVVDNPNLRGPWTISLTNGGQTSSVRRTLPPAATQVPFVQSITLSTDQGGGSQISWTPPPGTQVSGYRVNIYDKTDMKAGRADLIVSNNQTETSYRFPTNLKTDHKYSAEISLIQTINGATSLDNSNVQAMSRVYADFQPLRAGAPVVNLPLARQDGSYQYNLTVESGKTYYLDPDIAVGYMFKTGMGDPNFASVILPELQTAYGISYSAFGTLYQQTAYANIEFYFPTGGVDSFTVTGIDPALGLDPANPTAFVTGVSFTGSGRSQGTQTPVTVSAVPGPVAGAGLPALCALGGFVAMRRRRPSAEAGREG